MASLGPDVMPASPTQPTYGIVITETDVGSGLPPTGAGGATRVLTVVASPSRAHRQQAVAAHDDSVVVRRRPKHRPRVPPLTALAPLSAEQVRKRKSGILDVDSSHLAPSTQGASGHGGPSTANTNTNNNRLSTCSLDSAGSITRGSAVGLSPEQEMKFDDMLSPIIFSPNANHTYLTPHPCNNRESSVLSEHLYENPEIDTPVFAPTEGDISPPAASPIYDQLVISPDSQNIWVAAAKEREADVENASANASNAAQPASDPRRQHRTHNHGARGAAAKGDRAPHSKPAPAPTPALAPAPGTAIHYHDGLVIPAKSCAAPAAPRSAASSVRPATAAAGPATGSKPVARIPPHLQRATIGHSISSYLTRDISLSEREEFVVMSNVRFMPVMLRSGKIGFVPESAIHTEPRWRRTPKTADPDEDILVGQSLSLQSYFHGSICRREAETRLANAGLVDGLFLIRVKNEASGIYALSVAHHGQVQHHLIHRASAVQEGEAGSSGALSAVQAARRAGFDPFLVNNKPIRKQQLYTLAEVIAYLSDPAVFDPELPPLLRVPCFPPPPSPEEWELLRAQAAPRRPKTTMATSAAGGPTTDVPASTRDPRKKRSPDMPRRVRAHPTRV